MASRTSNGIKNILSNLGLKLLMLGLQFATRTIFIHNLGSIYNGINSLLTSILSFLNIAELGIGSAIVFAMYKPVAEENHEKTNQYLAYYKRVYHLLGLVVIGVGLAMMPFIPYMMEEATEIINKSEIYVVYALYLVSSASSYYVYAYRGGLITANQHDYRLTPINYTASVLIVIAQGVSLIIFDGFLGFCIYVALPIVISIIRSLINGIYALKWYPYIKETPKGKLDKSEIKEIHKNVLGLAISKISTIINNSVDSIVISAMIGVTILGKYYNYQTLILMVSSFVGILFTSLVPSVGNLNAEASVEHKKRIFNVMYFASFWIYGMCTVCYFTVVQPFVVIWIGNENVINSIFLIVIICINFLTQGLCSPVDVFRAGCGLYYQGKYRPIFTVIFNIGFSVLFGYFIGLPGIILATILSRFITMWWYDAHIVFKYAFNEKCHKYLIDYLIKMLFVCVVTAIAYLICLQLPLVGVWKVLTNFVISVVLFNVIFLLFFGRTSEMKYFVNAIKGKFGRKKNKATINNTEIKDEQGDNVNENDKD